MSPPAVALAGLAALAVAMGIGRFAFTPVLPMMQAEGSIGLAAGGWLAAANYAGYLAGAVSAPLLSSARAIRLGLAAIALLTLAMAFTDMLVLWMVLRALAGIASAWVLVHVSAWALYRLSAGYGGVLYAGVGAGIAVAGAVCFALIHFAHSARAAWLVLGGVSLFAGVLLWPLFHPEKHAGLAHAPVRWDRETLRLVLCYAAFGFGYIIPATFIPAFARETLHDPLLYGWAWPIFGAAAAASTIAVTPLVRRLGERNVWLAGHLVMAMGVAAPLVLPGLAGVVLCALCVGATFMVITMAGLQEARRLGGASLLAAMTAGFAAGQIAGPAFVSVLVHFGGRPTHASIAAALLLVLSACALLQRSSACTIACRP